MQASYLLGCYAEHKKGARVFRTDFHRDDFLVWPYGYCRKYFGGCICQRATKPTPLLNASYKPRQCGDGSNKEHDHQKCLCHAASATHGLRGATARKVSLHR